MIMHYALLPSITSRSFSYISPSTTTMNDLETIIAELLHFRDQRDWEQFHDTKNLAVAISIEAAELNELFLWKTKEQSEEVSKQSIKEELADILSYCFLLAHKHDLSIRDIILEKIKLNSQKYPVNKSKGKADKYDRL